MFFIYRFNTPNCSKTSQESSQSGGKSDGVELAQSLLDCYSTVHYLFDYTSRGVTGITCRSLYAPVSRKNNVCFQVNNNLP